MAKVNQNIILEKTGQVFSQTGQQFSLRKLAKELGISPSVMYHHFKNEEALLESMFDYLNTELGRRRKSLSPTPTASDMLRQRIEFQIENSQYIVAVLKYYLAKRNKFKRNQQGYVPDKSTLHIVEVLEKGRETGEFRVDDVQAEAKVITHAINGFLLEYYPVIPEGKDKEEVVSSIHKFLMKALSLKGGD